MRMWQSNITYGEVIKAIAAVSGNDYNKYIEFADADNALHHAILDLAVAIQETQPEFFEKAKDQPKEV